jgi:hypothetical protein
MISGVLPSACPASSPSIVDVGGCGRAGNFDLQVEVGAHKSAVLYTLAALNQG